MPKPTDPAVIAYWAGLARKLQGATNGARGELIAKAREANGLRSNDAVYRRLKTYAGWESGRKRRTDAGKMGIDTNTLQTVAGIYREGARADGRQIMSLEQAASVAEQSGHSIPVSRSQLGRYLRARRMDRVAQASAEHFAEMRSLHPNHVHEIDPSLCVLYYLRGKQHMIRETELYKNKLDRLAKVDWKIWRYVRTDHASGDIDVRYFQAAGESPALLFDFMLWTWGQQEGRVSHGLPRILVWDRGSANTAHGISYLLDGLEVDHIAHAVERANVKGQVENANLLVERGFESRLRFEPVADVDELNQRVSEWAAAYNANLLPKIDSRIRRPGAEPMVRTDLWLTIRSEQLREMPPREVCARLLEGRPAERTVSRQAYITYSHPQLGRSTKYHLRTISELHRGDKVQVAPLLVGPDGEQGLIRLRWISPAGEERTWRVAPEIELDRYGRPLSCPVWGEEHKAPKKRQAERVADELDAAAYPPPVGEDAKDTQEQPRERARKARQKNVVPFSGKINAVSHIKDIQHPTYLTPQGAEVAVQAPEDQTPPVPLVRALSRLRQAWGRPITREETQFLSARFGAAIPETELQRLAAAAGLSQPDPAAIGGRNP